MTEEFKLRHYQNEVIEDTEASLEFGSTNLVIESPPACVPGYTEFLTPNGWKRIDKYNNSDLICVWNQNGETKFEKPIKYINQDCNDDFINIKTNGINITVSENHKMPYLTNKGRKNSNNSVKIAKELFKLGEISIPRNFSSPVQHNKIDFTIDEMKVLIMQSADGNVMYFKSGNTIRINLKKERKKERARLLLKNANIKYNERIIKKTGYSIFTYKFKCTLKDLSFLYLLNQEQLCSLIYDIVFWDGSNQNKDRTNYTGATFHGNYRDVSAAQYALSAALGKYVSISKDKRKYKNEDIYSCRVSSNNKSFIKIRRNDGAKSAIIDYEKPIDNKHYCFETSTGFWLMRQNGNIYPTGNSGKSIIISETARRLANKNKKIVISINISALLDQIAKHLDIVKADYSILKSGRESEFDETKLIQLCQAQTLHARLSKMDKFKSNYFISDETHREYNTKRTREILEHLEIDARIGYSGTPYDEAGFLLEGCELLRTTTAIDLQNQGFLCPIRYYVPKWAESVDFSNLKKSGNDYSEKDLNEIINTDNHLRLAIESMNKMNAKNKKTMIFCSGIEQAEKFAEMLQKEGYNAFAYHSKQDKKESEKILNAFINNTKYIKKLNDNEQPTLFDDSTSNKSSGSDVTCLLSVNKLGIGFDCPDVKLGVQLRPTKIRSLYIQQACRLARTSKPLDMVLNKLSDKIKYI